MNFEQPDLLDTLNSSGSTAHNSARLPDENCEHLDGSLTPYAEKFRAQSIAIRLSKYCISYSDPGRRITVNIRIVETIAITSRFSFQIFSTILDLIFGGIFSFLKFSSLSINFRNSSLKYFLFSGFSNQSR